MRQFYLFAVSAFLLLSCQRREDLQPRPNIIFILTDDLGYGDLGVFWQNQRRQENKRDQPSHFTPNLDALAADGAILTQQYCNAPVCAPSRASLLLGVHQGHANVRDNQFDKALEDNFTLGNVLQRAGYATVAVGKWGLQGLDRWEEGSEWTALPMDRGFDDFFGYVRHVDGHEHYPKEGLYRGKKQVYQGREDVSQSLDKCYTGDLWTAYAKKWMTDEQQQAEKKPFFMYLAYDIPHAVLELPTQAYPEGGGVSGGMQWTGEPGKMISTASGEIDSYVHPDYAGAMYDDDNDPSTPEVPWPDTYKRYATVVRRIDDAIGDIRQLLKDLDIDNNTLIIFSSDNGPSIESYLPEQYVPNEPTFFHSYGPFDGIKRDVWEGGVRMPTVATWPARIPAKRVVESPSMFSDWLATFCDAAGVPVPARSDGVSLLPSLTGIGNQELSTVYVEYYNNQRTPSFEEFEASRRGRVRNQMQLIRMGDYVGVRYDIQSPDDDFEIYDVVHDPKEKSNVALNELGKNLQRQMKEKVLRLRRPDTSAVRPYDSAFIPSTAPQNVQAGVAWSVFNGDFPWIPKTNLLKAAASGEGEVIDASLLGDHELLQCKGFIRIPEDGDYAFSLTASGTAVLRIHDATVIDADFGYKSGAVRSAHVRLAAGLHPFTFLYKRNSERSAGFSLRWRGPGLGEGVIPPGALYH